MWHYFTGVYGKKIKSEVFTRTCRKMAFGKTFIKVLSCLELRLNILVLRMRFATKQLESNALIENKFILVNGACRLKNHLVRVGDIVKKTVISRPTSRRLKLHRWRHRWRKKNRWMAYKKKKSRDAWRLGKKRRKSIFWLSKIVTTVNFLEVNHLIQAGLVLRFPQFGETMLLRSKKYLAPTMLKKLYFLF